MSRAERRREMRGQEKKEVTRVMTIAQIQQMKKDMADLIADELLMKVFGIATLVIRRLTCLVCGSRYVRQPEGDPNAEKVCEEICQKIYDLRMEITKNESSTD